MRMSSAELRNMREVFNPDKNPVLRKVYMDEGTQNQLLRSDMSRSYKELQRKFHDFDSFPIPAQKALLDLQFNIGDRKFQRQYYDDATKSFKPAWPKLFDAVENGDWKVAATESRRKDVQKKKEMRTFTTSFYRQVVISLILIRLFPLRLMGIA